MTAAYSIICIHAEQLSADLPKAQQCTVVPMRNTAFTPVFNNNKGSFELPRNRQSERGILNDCNMDYI